MLVGYRDLRGFIELSRDMGEVRDVRGAHWDLELGALIEATAERMKPDPPMLLFDEIADYPTGHRAAGLLLGSTARCAIALGLSPEEDRLSLVRQSQERIQQALANPIEPVCVDGAAVLEHTFEGEDIDILSLPVPRYKLTDGGRYIGTGDLVINRDPESGYVNIGTYRVQVHEAGMLGLWMSPGQQGREICSRYWREGKACPVVMVFGMDPVTFMASHTKLAWGKSEFELVGGLRGAPAEVIDGPLTGLPIPANAEIAIEGLIPPPDEESHTEGPFGEWTGYSAGGTPGTGDEQPVVHVQAVYHRSSPILLAYPPTWLGAPTRAVRFMAGMLWSQLEAAGIPGITGVYEFTSYLIAVSIKQLYAGHAKQAGLGVLAAAAGARNGRFVVVVDDDIDVTSLEEVVWAMQTRADPASTIDIVSDNWSTPLDPRISPTSRANGDYTNSRAVIYATRPFTWKDDFPPVSRVDSALKDEVYNRFITSDDSVRGGA